MKPRITMLTLGVHDLEAAVSFYRDGLGFATAGIVGTEFERGAVAFFDLESGLKLALYPTRFLSHDAGVALQHGATPPISIGHNVRSRQEVDEVVEQARRGGAEIVKEPAETFWGGYAGYFRDPDRYLWEVAWNPSLLPTT